MGNLRARPRWLLAIAFTLSALCALLPFVFLLAGVPVAHDLPDHLAMADQFREGWREGSLYPRWSGRFNFGWGEPTGVFYPPLISSLTAALSPIAGGNLLASLYLSLGLFSLAGAFGLFRLVQQVAGPTAALMACLLFALTPYRAFELHAAGLFSAYSAGCLVPWAIFFLLRLASDRDGPWLSRPLLGWSAVFALIALLNLPCAVLTAYLTGIWTLLEAVISRDRCLPARVFLGAAWGALLAAVFLLPTVLELPSIVPPHSEGEPLYRSNFVFQRSGTWMPPGLVSLFDRMGAYPAALLLLAGLPRLFMRRRGGESEEGRPSETATCLRILGTLSLAALFLSTRLSEPLWALLPVLHHVHMPWRLLGLAAAPSAALAAVCLLGNRARFHRFLYPAGAGALVLLGLFAFLLDDSIHALNGLLKSADPVLLARSFHARQGYFLPRGAAEPARLRDHPLVDVMTPSTSVEVVEWGLSRRRLRYSSENGGEVGLRTFFFPGWTAKLASERGEPRLPLFAESGTGRMLLRLPEGRGEAIVSFESTPTRTAGAAASAAALLAWGAALILARRVRAAEPPSPAPAPPEKADAVLA